MTRFTDLLGEVADQAKLYDVLPGAVRSARRRRMVMRTSAGLTVAAAAVVLVAMFLVASRLGGLGGDMDFDRGPDRETGDVPAVVSSLLDSPTRGSLAADPAYVRQVLDRITKDPDAFGLPGDTARIRVLFAGDLPRNQRLVLVAGLTAKPRLIHLTGRTGGSARGLDLTGWEDVEAPVLKVDWRDVDLTKGYSLVLGPAGHEVSVSANPRYLADGTISREWQPVPSDFIVSDVSNVPRGFRVRISRAGKVLWEGAVTPPGTKRTGEVPLEPLFGRGKPAPRAAQVAADALAFSTGLVGPEIRYVVLWSDDFEVDDPNGGGSGLGQIATVMALTPDGGGPYTTIATDTNKEPNSRYHPSGNGILGDPEQGLIVMRMPTFGPPPPPEVQIVAPPAAVRVEVFDKDVLLRTAPLVNGVGRIPAPSDLDLTVRVFDAAGTKIAERPFADRGGLAPAGLYEPEIKGW
jgi:hypothetical protein